MTLLTQIIIFNDKLNKNNFLRLYPAIIFLNTIMQI
jgi:hypothetical protein